MVFKNIFIDKKLVTISAIWLNMLNMANCIIQETEAEIVHVKFRQEWEVLMVQYRQV